MSLEFSAIARRLLLLSVAAGLSGCAATPQQDPGAGKLATAEAPAPEPAPLDEALLTRRTACEPGTELPSGYPPWGTTVPTEERISVARAFREASGIAWDEITVTAFGQVFTAVKYENEHSAPDEALEAHWLEVLMGINRYTGEVLEPASANISSGQGTVKIGEAYLNLGQSVHLSPKGELGYRGPPCGGTPWPLSNPGSTCMSGLPLPVAVQMNYNAAACPQCNLVQKTIDIEVKHLAWHRTRGFVTDGQGHFGPRWFAWPYPGDAPPVQWGAPGFTWPEDRYRDTRIDAITGEDLSGLFCVRNPAYLCGPSPEAVKELGRLLSNPTVWKSTREAPHT